MKDDTSVPLAFYSMSMLQMLKFKLASINNKRFTWFRTSRHKLPSLHVLLAANFPTSNYPSVILPYTSCPIKETYCTRMSSTLYSYYKSFVGSLNIEFLCEILRILPPVCGTWYARSPRGLSGHLIATVASRYMYNAYAFAQTRLLSKSQDSFWIVKYGVRN